MSADALPTSRRAQLPSCPFALVPQVKMCVDTDTGTRYAIKIFKKSLLKRRQSRFQGTAFDDVSPHSPAPTAPSPRPAPTPSLP